MLLPAEGMSVKCWGAIQANERAACFSLGLREKDDT